MFKSNVERQLRCEVLVVGGGIAGCFAAIKAREQGAEVLLVDKGYVGKSGQSPYANNFLVFNPEWGHKLEDWMTHINRTSEYVNHRGWTELTIKDSYARYLDLLSYGIRFEQDETGQTRQIPGPSGITCQVRFGEEHRGDYLQILRKQALKLGVNILDRLMIVELLKQDNRIVGAVGLPVDNFEIIVIITKARNIDTPF